MKSAPYFLFFCHNYLLSAREFVILSYNKMNMVRSEIQNVKLRFGIIGNAEGLNRAIDVAIQVAPTDLSVLITGESGVGKENFADHPSVQPSETWTVYSRELWSYT